MVDVKEDGRALLEALLAAPVAWQTPEELARATGFGLDETLDLLAALDDEGWLSAWERPEDLVVTLSLAAASRLAVRLVESGPELTPKWAGCSDPEPPAPRAVGVFRGAQQAALELVVDHRPGPDDAVEPSQGFSGRSTPSGAREPSLPRPTILLGTGLSPWPGPVLDRGKTCPACRSGRLGPSTYCLCCDRWGLDHLLRDGRALRPAPARDPAEDDRKRELDRRSRREKRRARRAAQAQAERLSRRGPRNSGRN
ncbi:hypothetical protein P12x_002220 [Tundrisphaera lichenicola]|uniref:hypothetical protein n=1 Tax=Tundrisphaera lichenicola TaxID=2029860 RepID=UPI003EBE7D61